jgi:hypothetical protein
MRRMLSVTLNPPPGGRQISAARGTLTPLVLSGRWRSDDDPAPLIELQLHGRRYSAVANASTRTWQATVQLECPSRSAVVASISAWVQGSGGHSRPQTASSAPLFLRVRDPQWDPAYRLRGTVVDARRAPVIGVEVTAFDRDSGSRNDRLGSARSGDDGRFELHFVESVFAELPAERGPDLVFIARSSSGQALQAWVLDVRGGWLPNADQAPDPFLLQVTPATGTVLSPSVRAKWQAHGGSAGALGLPQADEAMLPGGRGGSASFAGGQVVRLVDFECSAVLGPMLTTWQALGGGAGWLGWPVADAVDDPTAGVAGARAQVFEHGVLRWQPGAAAAVASGHDFARIHGQLRAHVLARFFAIGRHGRRNWPSCFNRLAALPPAPGAATNAAADAQARWQIESHGGENPWLFGTALVAALAVEENAGNGSSRRALADWLTTARSLMAWKHGGPEGEGRLPLRWDAHGLLDATEPGRQFLPQGRGWTTQHTSADRHHLPLRTLPTMERLLGPRLGAHFADAYGAASQHATSYRPWELSMDELVGVVSSYWLIAKLCQGSALQREVRQQATWVGNYLADHGYWLVRPQGGLSYRGATGMLPVLEFGMAQALATAANGGVAPAPGAGPNFNARIGLQEALQLSGHWPQLAGPIGAWQALSWGALLASTAGATLATVAGLAVGSGLSLAFAGQVLSPSTTGAAMALALHDDAFDVAERPEVALGALALGAADKGLIYRNLFWTQADHADLSGQFKPWSVAFQGWLGITGLDHPDPRVQDTFVGWYQRRQARPAMEPKGMGSRTLFAAGIAALTRATPDAEAVLLAKLDRAVVELFRQSYFDPQPWTGGLDMHSHGEEPYECVLLPYWVYRPESPVPGPVAPYSPIDFLGAHALACWHSARRAASGQAVALARFPAALTASQMAGWPEPAVPVAALPTLLSLGAPLADIQGRATPVQRGAGYPLLDQAVRRPSVQPPPLPATNQVMADISVFVPALPPGEVDTGITVYPGQALQITATGTVWSGRLLEPPSGPEGLPQPAHDARWPLHTGIDPDATPGCLLARLQGWWKVGEGRGAQRWLLPDARRLSLRINEGEPTAAGTGGYTVRIRVLGDGSGPAVLVPIHPLDDGAVLRTLHPADLIEVTVEPGAGISGGVELVLAAAGNINARKELLLPGLSPPPTLATQGSQREARATFSPTELAATGLRLRRADGLAVRPVRDISPLPAWASGTRVTLRWRAD